MLRAWHSFWTARSRRQEEARKSRNIEETFAERLGNTTSTSKIDLGFTSTTDLNYDAEPKRRNTVSRFLHSVWKGLRTSRRKSNADDSRKAVVFTIKPGADDILPKCTTTVQSQPRNENSHHIIDMEKTATQNISVDIHKGKKDVMPGYNEVQLRKASNEKKIDCESEEGMKDESSHEMLSSDSGISSSHHEINNIERNQEYLPLTVNTLDSMISMKQQEINDGTLHEGSVENKLVNSPRSHELEHAREELTVDDEVIDETKLNSSHILDRKETEETTCTVASVSNPCDIASLQRSQPEKQKREKNRERNRVRKMASLEDIYLPSQQTHQQQQHDNDKRSRSFSSHLRRKLSVRSQSTSDDINVANETEKSKKFKGFGSFRFSNTRSKSTGYDSHYTNEFHQISKQYQCTFDKIFSEQSDPTVFSEIPFTIPEISE